MHIRHKIGCAHKMPIGILKRLRQYGGEWTAQKNKQAGQNQ